MRYTPIEPRFYIENRKNYNAALKPSSLAVFNSNDIMPTNADGTMPFRQNNDLLHLSGIDQEETILVISPDNPNPKHKEVLFIRKTSEEISIWEGAKLTKEQATEISGIETVYWTEEFDKIFRTMMFEAEYVYLNSNEHLRAVIEVETRDARFNKWCKKEYPLHNYERSAPIMHDLRSIKHELEIEKMQEACDITESGFRRVLKMIKPGVKEFEIEAEYMHEFLRSGSRGFAYTPIIAAGFDSCVLHYIDNNKATKEGDILLMDVGAEYANYAADMTRTIPVNGKYTNRQKAVYNAVLRVMRGATKMLVPGITLDDYHKAVGQLMEKELVDLGLLTMNEIKDQDPTKPAYKKYFMHGTSHYIGLDVHDVGSWSKPMRAGNVFTCEPGIYIREENLGIRIENDILITDDGQHDLMKNIPIEVEEIEEIMNS